VSERARERAFRFIDAMDDDVPKGVCMVEQLGFFRISNATSKWQNNSFI
jgi:hypothetical protein